MDDRKTRITPLRTANIIAAAALFLLNAGLTVHAAIAGSGDRIIVFIGVAFLFPLPFVLELLFRKRLGDFALTVYLTFVFLAAVLGSALGFYGKFHAYDKITHTVFGYIGCLFGLLLMCKLGSYRDARPAFVCITVLAVSLMCGALWEIFEFSGDRLLGQISQGRPVVTDGGAVTDVSDTMYDLICNLIGALVFLAHYIIHRLTKKNLLMQSIAADFSKR